MIRDLHSLDLVVSHSVRLYPERWSIEIGDGVRGEDELIHYRNSGENGCIQMQK